MQNINRNRPIIIVIGNFKNGGIARHATVLANGLALHGWKNITILVTKDKSIQSFFDFHKNVIIICLNDKIRKIGVSCFGKILLCFRILLYQFKTQVRSFWGILISKCHSDNRIMNPSVVPKKQKLGAILGLFDDPVIISLGLEYVRQVSEAMHNGKCSIFYWTKTYAQGEVGSLSNEEFMNIVRNVSCSICQTIDTAEYLKSQGVENAEVIRNPIQISCPIYTGPRTKVIVNFCRISKEKRLDLLIQAFSRLYEKYPEYMVHIYGNLVTQEEIILKDKLLKLIEDLHLQDSIKIFDAQKDIHNIVKDAAMFVSTSDFEGLSNSMLEAMAIGMPCVCTDCDGGGAREVIQNGYNGLLIPKNDVQALYDAMLLFVENQELARECGKNASKIREELDIANIIGKLEDVITRYR